MPVNIGEVTTFANPKADKAQALKVLEEAAEVFGAWQAFDSAEGFAAINFSAENLVDEIADTIQACANLAAALGVDDMLDAMRACEARNHARGRL